MTCFNPIKAWQNPRADLDIPPQIYYDMKKIRFKEVKGWKEIKIPCNRCLGCKLDLASDWATRICMEAKEWKNNCFVTLTYNNKNLPINELGQQTLIKEHLSKFLKNLRNETKGSETWIHPIKNIEEKPIRFFGCGEYGTKFLRPHLHLALFNYKPKDLKLYKPNKYGDPIYMSKTIQDIWGKGFVTVEDLNYTTANYIARYVQKKAGLKPNKLILTGEIEEKEKIDERNGQPFIHIIKKREKQKFIKQPEFILMSRGAGLGLVNWLKHKDEIIQSCGIWVKEQDTLKLKHIPRYFKKLMNREDWEKFAFWQHEQEKKGIEREKELLNKISYNELPEINKDIHNQKQEKILQDKLKHFQRNSII